MTYVDRTLEALRQTSQRLCDDCLTLLVGLSQRQMTSAACESLAGRGLISRGVAPCDSCGRTKKSSLSPTSVIQAVDLADLPVVRGGAPRRWHWEANVQSALVTWLVAEGYSIRTVDDTTAAIASRNISAVSPQGSELWVSVRGYPDSGPSPSCSAPMEAREWFSSAAFDLILCHGENPRVDLALGLPDGFETYTTLAARTVWFRRTLPFTIFWVSETGAIRVEQW